MITLNKMLTKEKIDELITDLIKSGKKRICPLCGKTSSVDFLCYCEKID